MPMGKFFVFRITSNLSFGHRLFLGPCNSERAAEVMKQSSDVNSPIVGLRFNSIKTDSESTVSTTTSSKSMKLPTPFVRVDTYNGLLPQLFYSFPVDLIF
jgi:hypothetical protein